MNFIIVAVVGLLVIFLVYRIFKTIFKWLLLIGIALLLVAGYYTNPTKKIQQDYVIEEARSKGIKKIRKKNIVVDDYKVFSVTKLKVENDEKIVGIGAFGKVWFIGDLSERANK